MRMRVRRRRKGRPACLVLSALAMLALMLPPAGVRAADATLVEAARKEGKLVWYTTQIINELAAPMAEAFKAAYGIDVQFVGRTGRELINLVTEAARTGRPGPDVIDGRATVPALKRAGHLLKWQPSTASRLPPEMVDEQGYWVACNVFMNTLAYNPEVVAREALPRTLDDLLRPEWTGRLVWSTSPTLSAAPGFIGMVLREKGRSEGRAYLERLSRQQIAGGEITSREVIEKVIERELPVALQVFNHQAATSAAKGAPIAWAPLEPVTGSLSVVAITRNAAHPNAAKLFVEFLITREGQRLFQEADYMPADPEIEPKDPTLLPRGGKFRAIYFTPEEIEEQMPGWVELYNELFK